MGIELFNIFTSRKPVLDFTGATDWHSHILPGVDDGIAEVEDSLKILGEYERLGFKRVWLTPHVMEDYPNKPVVLKERFEALKSVYNGPLDLKLAAENMLDGLFVDRLASKDLLPIGESGNSLLVETSYFTPPANFDELISSVLSSGYFPILAHPERYVYMEMKDYERLKAKGVKMQLNLMSLGGSYGKVVRDKAHRLLQGGFYDRAGSDIHRVAQLPLLSSVREDKKHRSLIQALLKAEVN